MCSLLIFLTYLSLPQVTYIFILFYKSNYTLRKRFAVSLVQGRDFCRRHISWCFILLELPPPLARLWELNKANTFKKLRGTLSVE